MNDRIEQLVQQIESLRQELQAVLKEQEQEFLYKVEGTRVEFEERLRRTHKELRQNVFAWLRASQLRNVLSAPFIYGMIVPIALFDLGLTVYQQICFRLYRIPRVDRSEYFVFDRHHLGYLNSIQKLNCIYCAYANGVISYAREISSRTEQYWCPIKHARKLADPHERYLYFVPYGAAQEFQQKQHRFRTALRRGGAPRACETDDSADISSVVPPNDKAD
ncbi:hypothetical protein QKW35_14285 [Pontibacterium granulatum]|uniref:hypothetical protein n=1 Tax=Pontibacterium granulatum TaxID=2036029 RepID=UPI00249B13AF|nr:hypothetical protein [Pontibacterium granulatum]MDI3325543.1 hypothetical protein [Pontibacterium granulatum]